MKVPFLSEQEIADRAEQLLADYVRRTQQPIRLPVPIENIITQVLDIPVLWEPIPPRDGREIISKITQPIFNQPSVITLNEDLKKTKFGTYPGLEQTALGHETGHAVFHIEQGLLHQLPLGLEIAPDDFISSTESLTGRLRAFMRQASSADDDWWREWQAHTFMRHVLMPRSLLSPLVDERELRTWPGLYRLRDRLHVTISALVVHLEKLDIIRIDAEKRIYLQTPAARGQGSLPLR